MIVIMKVLCWFQNGMFFCVVSFVTGARFQGSLCKSREEAAESAAGVALLQMVSCEHRKIILI